MIFHTLFISKDKKNYFASAGKRLMRRQGGLAHKNKIKLPSSSQTLVTDQLLMRFNDALSPVNEFC